MLYDLAKLENAQPGRIKKSKKLSHDYERFLAKSIDEYKSTDLVFYFSNRYEKIIGEPYRFSMQKESAQMKRLLETYGIFGVVNLIEYAIRYKRPISIGLLSSNWVNTWYMEMISSYGTSKNTLKYRCLLLSPHLSSSHKDKVVWMINQAEEAKERDDRNRYSSIINSLDNIYAETQCTPFLSAVNTG
jgi:hypothetical protein